MRWRGGICSGFPALAAVWTGIGGAPLDLGVTGQYLRYMVLPISTTRRAGCHPISRAHPAPHTHGACHDEPSTAAKVFARLGDRRDPCSGAAHGPAIRCPGAGPRLRIPRPDNRTETGN